MSDELRAELHETWEKAAEHWERTADRMAEMSGPVTSWLLEAAHLAPGRRVLELGAGPGDVGIRAAGAVRPGGEVVITDVVEGMVAAAGRRAEAAGALEVATRVLDAESIDEDAASFDAVISRWGLMFTLDAEAPFRECRRVLRPGGRLALAAWAPAERNPFLGVSGRVLLDQGLIERRVTGDVPGPFRFAAPGRLEELLVGAGFAEPEVAELPFSARFGRWEDVWFVLSEQSNAIRDGLAVTNERGAGALEEGIRERFEPFRGADGAYQVPFVALGAAATA